MKIQNQIRQYKTISDNIRQSMAIQDKNIYANTRQDR